MVPVARLIRLKLKELRKEYEAAISELPGDIKKMTKAEAELGNMAADAAAIRGKVRTRRAPQQRRARCRALFAHYPSTPPPIVVGFRRERAPR
jgi:hypothetical protein